MGVGAKSAGAIDVTRLDILDQQTEVNFDGGGCISIRRGDIYAVARAFGFDPENCAAETTDIETIQAVALAHHLLGLKPDKFRETGLALAQRLDTWREFDSARRLGAATPELQRILIGGLFNEVPK